MFDCVSELMRQFWLRLMMQEYLRHVLGGLTRLGGFPESFTDCFNVE